MKNARQAVSASPARLFFCCSALLCAATGCRSDPSVALLEAEMRWLEDQYYVLEEQYHQKCRELESCRLAHQARSDTDRETDAQRDTDEPRGPSSRRPSSRRGAQEQLPEPSPPDVEGIPDINPPAGSGDLELPPPGEQGVQPSAFVAPADARVQEVVLNRVLTGGYDRDGRPGDDGVMVVIEPRNAAGQFVPIAGELSIKLIDPRELTPAKQTFAHWKLTRKQAAAKLRRSLLGRGVHLELAWPSGPPRADEFELQVVYTTADGRKLNAEREIHIDPPRAASARWTPVSESQAARENALGRRSSSERTAGGARPGWSPHR